MPKNKEPWSDLKGTWPIERIGGLGSLLHMHGYYFWREGSLPQSVRILAHSDKSLPERRDYHFKIGHPHQGFIILWQGFILQERILTSLHDIAGMDPCLKDKDWPVVLGFFVIVGHGKYAEISRKQGSLPLQWVFGPCPFSIHAVHAVLNAFPCQYLTLVF